MPVDEEKWNVIEIVGSAPSPRGDILVEVAAYDTQPPAVYLSRARKKEGHKKLGGLSSADITGLLPLLEKASGMLAKLGDAGEKKKDAGKKGKTPTGKT